MTRTIALAASVAAAGALGAAVVGRAAGMGGSDVLHLLLLMLPALGVTLVATVAARPLLARTSLRQRLLAVALVAVVASLANLAVLAWLMLVDPHDAALLGSLLVYSVGAGVGASMVVARSTAQAVDRLVRTADRIAEGDLRARVGPLDAGPELDALAEAFDEMAAHLTSSLARERAADDRRRDLVTAVSHDLRTPLAGLRAMVEAIEDRVVDDPSILRRYAAEMRRAVEALTALTDDLFELVQLDAGAIEAESGRARLDEVVGSAVAACSAQAEEKGLAVHERLDGVAAERCSPRLVRVLQNLLQNAIRHTPPHGTVTIEARRRPDYLEVVVEDTGGGIEPAALPRVFDPFWRGDAARTSPGSGLGLALAKRIVEALGGVIRVQSEPARGSRFAVQIPGG